MAEEKRGLFLESAFFELEAHKAFHELLVKVCEVKIGRNDQPPPYSFIFS